MLHFNIPEGARIDQQSRQPCWNSAFLSSDIIFRYNMVRCKERLKGLAMCILDGCDRNWRVSMGCRRHRGLFADILSGLAAHQRQPDIGMGNKEGLQEFTLGESTLLPGSKKPMTEKGRRRRRPNLLLQMSPAPFFGPAAPDLWGNQQHELLGEPGEGNLGGSWAMTWANNHKHHTICSCHYSAPDNPV